MTVTHFYEDPDHPSGDALCLEPRWYSLTDKRSEVTCKRCLALMKLPLAQIRLARAAAQERRASK